MTSKQCLSFGGVVFALFIQSVSGLEIKQVEPTPLFPKPAAGQPLKQQVRLHLNNDGGPVMAVARITVGGQAAETQDLGVIAKGQTTVSVLILDSPAPTPVLIELVSKEGQLLASQKQNWQPQKKWKIYCCSYSHQDLGFGDYPHRVRTGIRHENILLPLRFCRETDNWPEDAKYRWNIETSEPLTGFISFLGKDAGRELARRMREGRIALGRLHNTVNTEELSPELMARLFYMSGRYAVDLLGVAPNKTMQNDDVIGQTWPLATYAAEADVSYFFHGHGLCGGCEKPAEAEPVFYWQAPDARGRVLERATPYGGDAGDGRGDGSEEYIQKSINRLGANWPYDSLLLHEGTDYQMATRDFANQVHAWNEKYAYPRMLSATLDMFFDAIASQAKPSEIKTFTGDSNNQWSEQDYAAARASGQARKLNEALPATETLASIAQALAGGGDQWINMYQGYHRLLQYWEHTNGKSRPHGNMVWYETELEENREMVREAACYQQQVFSNASQRLAGIITRTAEKNLIVFNPLPHPRSDVVRTAIPAGIVVDSVTGEKLPVQQMPDGTAVFIAKDIPATGYRTYSLAGKPRFLLRQETTAGQGIVPEAVPVLENKFYRIKFNRDTGALASLFDKTLGVELVDTNAPHAFNEYLYEYRKLTGGLNFDSTWSRMAKAVSVVVNRGPVADVLTVAGTAEGVRTLKQTVMLYHDLPRVDFGIWMDKSPFRGLNTFFPGDKYLCEKEAVFIALPLAIPEFTIHHELPGAVIEPYRQQFAGSATDHYAIQRFTDLSNDKYGVTVSPVEGSLVCYGEPTSSPMLGGTGEYNFKRDQTYPKTSRLYLYLMNNMFDCNIAADQRGPVSFNWALRSHAGDWKTGNAGQFGLSVQNPLVAWRADGKNSASLPASGSFMSVDAPHVTCSVIKPAEANGRGFIIRLNETLGNETAVTVSLPMLNLESARATSLVENDRLEQYPVVGHSFKITLPKFGVKTIRVTCAADAITVSSLAAKAVADMRVDLSWQSEGGNVSHYNIYRDTQPDCARTQLNFIGQSATGSFSDRPRVNLGGWLRSCLAPKTAYYYRIVPVDRAGNPGTPSAVATVTTPDSAEANLQPVAVEGLRAILVSAISPDNFVNLLFRTACEPDVMRYEIHRCTQPGFPAGTNTLVGVVNSDDIPPRSGGYGEQPTQYKVREYDHAIFVDRGVEPRTTYYYKVRAVDAAGQKGAFSGEVSMRTKGVSLAGVKVTAQSVFMPPHGAEKALDGDFDLNCAWISKPYGGGTKDKPLDVWWQVEFLKKAMTITGVKILGDHRGEIPLLKNLQVQVRAAGGWKTVGNLKNATDKDVRVVFAQPVTTDALRVFVPATDIPNDGVVRICELIFILPDGTEAKSPFN